MEFKKDTKKMSTYTGIGSDFTNNWADFITTNKDLKDKIIAWNGLNEGFWNLSITNVSKEKNTSYSIGTVEYYDYEKINDNNKTLSSLEKGLRSKKISLYKQNNYWKDVDLEDLRIGAPMPIFFNAEELLSICAGNKLGRINDEIKKIEEATDNNPWLFKKFFKKMDDETIKKSTYKIEKLQETFEKQKEFILNLEPQNHKISEPPIDKISLTVPIN